MRKFHTLMVSVCVLSLISFKAIAQAPAPDWTKLYAGPTGKGAAARHIKVANGYVYVAGAGDGGVYVVRYDSQNPSAPVLVMSYPGAEYANDLEVDASGNVYVAARSTVKFKTSNNDYVTIKFNANGSLAWAQTYAGPAGGFDCAYGIAVDMNGNVFVTGSVDDLTTKNGHAIVTIKYSSFGQQLWTARLDELENVYGTDKWERPSDIVLDDNGDVYITGKIGTVMMVAKYAGNYTGEGLNPVIWRDLIAEGTDGRSIGISNGNIIASGWGGAIASYSPSGTRNWVRHYEAAFWDMELTSFAIYLTGSLGRDMYTAKYDLQGNFVWGATITTNATARPSGRGIAVDACNNAYVTGFMEVQEGNKTTSKLPIIKYSPSGSKEWEIRLPGSGFDIKTDVSGTVYVTGDQYVSRIQNMITAKYPSSCTPPQTVEPFSTMEESGLNSVNNYPNPFRSSTSINFRLAKAGYISLNVFDLTGRRIQTLIQGQRNAGQHTVKFSGNNLPAGTYIYRLEADGYSKTGRMILEK